MVEKESPKITRRDVMKLAIVGIGGIVGTVLGLPAIPYIIGPALKQAADEWIRLGTVSKVEIGNPTLFKTTIETQTGWITTEEQISAYILTEDGQNYVAMSNVCTHLGCRVRWISEENSFFCPCHNGVFGKDGSVVSGPPPKPLERYETKVEEGILFVKRG